MVSRANLTVGLTGGIGCGKSTAATFFMNRGFQRLDADATVHDILRNNQDVAEAIRGKFGDSMVAPDGSVRRDRMGVVVFNNSTMLAWLENLLHPLVYAQWRKIFASAQGQMFIVEVPLLFEKGLANWFDFTVCVTTDSVLQLRRLEQKGIPPELARQRQAKQMPLARKCELADHVLLNDGSTDFLREQVNALADRLLKLPTDRPQGHIHVSSP